MPRLLTFGEAMLRFSTPPGQPLETARHLDLRTAGAESNVAAAAANLGIETFWWSKLPNSPLGRRVTRDLRSHRVRPVVRWTDSGRQGTYYIEDAGAPRGTSVIYDRSDTPIRGATHDELAEDIDISQMDACFTTGITPALSQPLTEMTRGVFTRAGEADVPTIFDVNYRSKLWAAKEARVVIEQLLGLVDILVLAERDAKSVLAHPVDADPEAIADRLTTDYDTQLVIITHGDTGVTAMTNTGTVYEQPAIPTDTFDPIGSGDAFVGGFLSGYLRGQSIREALAIGVTTAAVKRTMMGDIATVTPMMIDRIRSEKVTDINR